MPRGSAFLSWVFSICALGSSACASVSPALVPGQVPAGQGGLFGRVAIVSKGNAAPICSVVFSDEDGERKGAASLKESDWVFITLKPGPTYISTFVCAIGTSIAQYETRALKFDVPGGDRLVYFGHVDVDMDSDRSGVAFVLGGLAGLAVDALEASAENPQHEVQNKFEVAVIEYRKRYGQQAGALKPEVSIAGNHLASASARPRAGAAGFALGKDVAAAEARCTGANLTWQKLDDRRFSCSGAPIDLGLPVTVQLTRCAGVLCEVAVNGSSDGAAWSALVERFTKLSKRLDGDHGEQPQRGSLSLDDCADGIESCFAAGRARTSAMWWWPDRTSVSLVLDGGPPGSLPSLSLVYGSAALREGKP